MSQLILDLYPVSPGFKREGTSELSAKQSSCNSRKLQALVLHQLERSDLTADECAFRLGEDKLSIRPRFSELQAMDLIVETDLRRKNESGKSAIVWKIKRAAVNIVVTE